MWSPSTHPYALAKCGDLAKCTSYEVAEQAENGKYQFFWNDCLSNGPHLVLLDLDFSQVQDEAFGKNPQWGS